MIIYIPKECKNCGGHLFEWDFIVQNKGGCEDGRLKLNEISGVYVLGCQECSETLKTIRAEEVIPLLNIHLKG
jgi:hypothetical protein